MGVGEVLVFRLIPMICSSSLLAFCVFAWGGVVVVARFMSSRFCLGFFLSGNKRTEGGMPTGVYRLACYDHGELPARLVE
jgi:hypothetical protein